MKGKIMASKFDDALIGRAILAGAIRHLKDFKRHYGLDCTSTSNSHIELWKNAIHRKMYGDGEDEVTEALQDMADCPLCSSIIAAWQARKLLKGKLGRLSGGLTNAGQALRRKRFPVPIPEPNSLSIVTSVIDCMRKEPESEEEE
jgi:hypothetical protein